MDFPWTVQFSRMLFIQVWHLNRQNAEICYELSGKSISPIKWTEDQEDCHNLIEDHVNRFRIVMCLSATIVFTYFFIRTVWFCVQDFYFLYRTEKLADKYVDRVLLALEKHFTAPTKVENDGDIQPKAVTAK